MGLAVERGYPNKRRETDPSPDNNVFSLSLTIKNAESIERASQGGETGFLPLLLRKLKALRISLLL